MDRADIEAKAAELGFECMGYCAASELVVREDVRAMCSAETCRAYGHSWACPPACGSIHEFSRMMHEHETCIVVQTVATIEDEFDYDGMEAAGVEHKKRFARLVAALEDAEGTPGTARTFMALSAGTCRLCEECTYPDAPCRKPQQRLVSMEATGLNVSEVCTIAGIPYNHGPETIAYSSCIVFS